jgi:hypothetical protein
MARETRRYEIAFEERDGYLRAQVRGREDSVSTSLAYWQQIAAEARSRNAAKILVIENFERSIPLMDVYEVAAALPEIVYGLKVAFVDERLDDFEANKFAEDVAVNRGAFGRVFAHENTAIAWLKSPDDASSVVRASDL